MLSCFTARDDLFDANIYGVPHIAARIHAVEKQVHF
jgi:hypothetical protein